MKENLYLQAILERIEELKNKQEEDSRLIRSFMAAIDQNLYEYSQTIFRLEKDRSALLKSQREL